LTQDAVPKPLREGRHRYPPRCRPRQPRSPAKSPVSWKGICNLHAIRPRTRTRSRRGLKAAFARYSLWLLGRAGLPQVAINISHLPNRQRCETTPFRCQTKRGTRKAINRPMLIVECSKHHTGSCNQSDNRHSNEHRIRGQRHPTRSVEPPRTSLPSRPSRSKLPRNFFSRMQNCRYSENIAGAQIPKTSFFSPRDGFDSGCCIRLKSYNYL